VAELRRLVLDQQFRAAERMLGSFPAGPDMLIRSLRQLCASGAEQLRVAEELESAAQAQRSSAQEACITIDVLLARWEQQILAEQARVAESPAAPGQRGSRRSRRLWRPFGRGDAEPEESESQLLDGAPEPEVLRPAAAPEPGPPAGPADLPEAEVTARVLGPLDLNVAGQRIARWNSLKARTVFQYLVVQIGRPVRREVLMELMWPDHTPDSARNNLNAALYSLRNTLNRNRRKVQYILYEDGCYLPNPELVWWIDRNEFLTALESAQEAYRGGHAQQALNSYRQAALLYRGPLFEDDTAGDWYLPEQRRLKELYLQALEHLTEMHLERRDLATAVQFGQLALSADACCEPVHRLLMRCYAQQHQQQLVSRQYRLCSAALQDELGVSPGADTIELFHRLTTRGKPELCAF
jgi:DNA-binding SARP family transcriptional activator